MKNKTVIIYKYSIYYSIFVMIVCLLGFVPSQTKLTTSILAVVLLGFSHSGSAFKYWSVKGNLVFMLVSLGTINILVMCVYSTTEYIQMGNKIISVFGFVAIAVVITGMIGIVKSLFFTNK